MENYMDESFIVTNNTIVTYSGQHPTMKIPGRFADIEISRIGNGAFMESAKLQCAIIPPKVSEIGSKAFFGCPELTSIFLPGGITAVGESAFDGCNVLSDITIYDLQLTASQYETFKYGSNRTSEGLYVMRQMPEHELVKKIVLSIDKAKPACQVPDGISALFQLTKLDENRGKFSLDKDITTIGFSKPSVPVTENYAFCEHIRAGISEVYAGKAEQKNDWYIRVGKEPPKRKTIIFTFDDSKTKIENGTVFLYATLKIGYFFWQSAQPIMCDREKYYIYRRYYLGFDPELAYVRRDIAAYTDRGLVTDREEAQRVYAKYKLLSIL